MLSKPWNSAIVSLILLTTMTIAHADGESETKKPLAIGDKAPEFVLNDLEGDAVSLGDQLKQGTTVIVVLRGYPGYQCPVCTQQFGELIGKADNFSDAKANMLFIYPGSATDLDKYAKEFVGGKAFPENYRFVTDPDFKFTDLYKLRWNAPQETAYPASFVVDSHGVIQFVKVSHSHGDRASGKELLNALAKINK